MQYLESFYKAHSPALWFTIKATLLALRSLCRIIKSRIIWMRETTHFVLPLILSLYRHKFQSFSNVLPQLKKPLVRTVILATITVTSKWSWWRLESPASRLFAQPFVQAQFKENIKLRVTGLCDGNSPVTGGFPSQRASNAEKCFHLMVSSWVLYIAYVYSEFLLVQMAFLPARDDWTLICVTTVIKNYCFQLQHIAISHFNHFHIRLVEIISANQYYHAHN